MLLFMLLALWFFRLQGDSFVTSNDWRAAGFYLTVLGLLILTMILYKFYLSSREESCREMCLANGQGYEYTAPGTGYGRNMGGSRLSRTEHCRCFSYPE